MSDEAFDYRQLGEPAEKAPSHVQEYLEARGWTLKMIRRAGLRYVSRATTIMNHWPATVHGIPGKGSMVINKVTRACWQPVDALVLVDPLDPTYAIARPWYEVGDLGKTSGPPKFVTPAGRELRTHVPSTHNFAHLLDVGKPLYVVESPLKAELAAQHGVLAVGVNGVYGWKVAGEKVGPKMAKDGARKAMRSDLMPMLLKDRRVIFCPDADARTNANVARAAAQFVTVALALGCQAEVLSLPDLETGKTGVDDFIAANGAKALKALPTITADSPEFAALRGPSLPMTEIGLAERFLE